MEPLDDTQIEDALTDLPGWEYDGEAISKSFEWSSFREAIDFVNDIADLAEDENHHPDLEVYFDEVIVSFRTHSEDAVTDRDIEMAQEVEDLAEDLDEDLDDDGDLDSGLDGDLDSGLDGDLDSGLDGDLDDVDIDELEDVDVGPQPDDDLDLEDVGHPGDARALESVDVDAETVSAASDEE